MSNRTPRHSPARWRVLEVLAAADAPLDRKEIIAATGIPSGTVYAALTWAVRARCVEVQTSTDEMPSGRKYLYSITATGREMSAAHHEESVS